MSPSPQVIGTIVPDIEEKVMRGNNFLTTTHFSQEKYFSEEPWYPLAEHSNQPGSQYERFKNWKTDKQHLILGIAIAIVLAGYQGGKMLIHALHHTPREHITATQSVFTKSSPTTSAPASGLGLAPHHGNTRDTQASSHIATSLITISITGAIAHPGIYHMSDDSRINDLIVKAGPIMANANCAGLNLADFLEDGEQIIISFAPENSYIMPAGKHIPIVAINSATARTIVKIPGISADLAKKIVAYRKEHGKFHSLDDLINISGIGIAKIEKIKPYVSLQ